jgi:hypothetical protein
VLYCIQGTFTGFHRVFTDDELYNNDNPQQFKDDYEGRIVISNGKTATDTTDIIAGRHTYDLELTQTSTSVVTRVLEGKFVVRGEVTR